jgi:hypothetical protein
LTLQANSQPSGWSSRQAIAQSQARNRANAGGHGRSELCSGVIAIQAACDAKIAMPMVEPRGPVDDISRTFRTMKRQQFHEPGTAFEFEIRGRERAAAMSRSGSLRCNANKALRDDL